MQPLEIGFNKPYKARIPIHADTITTIATLILDLNPSIIFSYLRFPKL